MRADLAECLAFLEGRGRTNRACALAAQLRAGRTPVEWAGISADPRLERRVGAFVGDLVRRVSYTNQIWSRIRRLAPDSAESGLFEGGVLEVASLRAPAGLLAGLRQAHARRLGVALDRVFARYSLVGGGKAENGGKGVVLRGIRL